MPPAAAAWVERLGLRPHPEGGWYAETHRSATRGPDGRSASTAICFLLAGDVFSAWHRLGVDEVWHHYDGDGVDLHTIDAAGAHRLARLGRDAAAGERPQAVVPAGVWQAAAVRGAWSLCGCTVAPGFEFHDFEIATREGLLARFPALGEVVRRFTR
jgi:hypothetical protein